MISPPAAVVGTGDVSAAGAAARGQSAAADTTDGALPGASPANAYALAPAARPDRRYQTRQRPVALNGVVHTRSRRLAGTGPVARSTASSFPALAGPYRRSCGRRLGPGAAVGRWRQAHWRASGHCWQRGARAVQISAPSPMNAALATAAVAGSRYFGGRGQVGGGGGPGVRFPGHTGPPAVGRWCPPPADAVGTRTPPPPARCRRRPR